MKKFISYIISITAILVLMMFILDIIYTQIYSRSNPRNTFQYILKTKDIKYDIVFLGSSRVASHLDIKLFESLSNKNAMNFGVNGISLNDNLLQLKLLIDNNISISEIFLQIDAEFNYEDASIVMTTEAMPFLKNKIVKFHFKKYNEDFNYLYYLPFYRYLIYDPKIGFREAFFSFFNKNPKIDPKIGFVPKYGSDLSIPRVLPLTVSERNIILEEIIRICKKNDIELTLYLSPFCSKVENKEYLESLKNKIPSLLDLSEGYDDELFYNCGHLNLQGAQLFTENLYHATLNNELK